MNILSVTVLTKNSEKHLENVLKALSSFDEVVILDNGSTDSTLAIARRFSNTKVYTSPFLGFGPLHNHASHLATHDWILSIDSDEIVSKELSQELHNLTLDPQCIYSFPRRTYYRGKWIRWCGWYPDRVTRLYNRQKSSFSEDAVHEKILSKDLNEISLNAPLIHYSYSDLSDFLTKMELYSTLFATQNKGKKNSSPLKALFHGWFAFFKSYFLKRGFLGGYEGFLISCYNAHTAFYKYLKLYEGNTPR